MNRKSYLLEYISEEQQNNELYTGDIDFVKRFYKDVLKNFHKARAVFLTKHKIDGDQKHPGFLLNPLKDDGITNTFDYELYKFFRKAVNKQFEKDIRSMGGENDLEDFIYDKEYRSNIKLFTKSIHDAIGNVFNYFEDNLEENYGVKDILKDKSLEIEYMVDFIHNLTAKLLASKYFYAPANDAKDGKFDLSTAVAGSGGIKSGPVKLPIKKKKTKPANSVSANAAGAKKNMIRAGRIQRSLISQVPGINSISDLQDLLKPNFPKNSITFSSGKPDGKWGNETFQAIIDLQVNLSNDIKSGKLDGVDIKLRKGRTIQDIKDGRHDIVDGIYGPDTHAIATAHAKTLPGLKEGISEKTQNIKDLIREEIFFYKIEKLISEIENRDTIKMSKPKPRPTQSGMPGSGIKQRKTLPLGSKGNIGAKIKARSINQADREAMKEALELIEQGKKNAQDRLRKAEFLKDTNAINQIDPKLQEALKKKLSAERKRAIEIVKDYNMELEREILKDPKAYGKKIKKAEKMMAKKVKFDQRLTKFEWAMDHMVDVWKGPKKSFFKSLPGRIWKTFKFLWKAGKGLANFGWRALKLGAIAYVLLSLGEAYAAEPGSPEAEAAWSKVLDSSIGLIPIVGDVYTIGLEIHETAKLYNQAKQSQDPAASEDPTAEKHTVLYVEKSRLEDIQKTHHFTDGMKVKTGNGWRILKIVTVPEGQDIKKFASDWCRDNPKYFDFDTSDPSKCEFEEKTVEVEKK